ncbi:MAG: hypothetical protein D6732_24185, partial [Methanobacteriota archaeon]
TQRLGMDTHEFSALIGKPLVQFFVTASGQRNVKWMFLIPMKKINDPVAWIEEMRIKLFGKYIIETARNKAANEAEFLSRIGLIMSTSTRISDRMIKARIFTKEELAARYYEIYKNVDKKIVDKFIEKVYEHGLDGAAYFRMTPRIKKAFKMAGMPIPHAFVLRSEGPTLGIKGCASRIPEEFVPPIMKELDVDLILMSSCEKIPVPKNPDGTFWMPIRQSIRDKYIQGSLNFETALAFDQEKSRERIMKQMKKAVWSAMHAMYNSDEAAYVLGKVENDFDEDLFEGEDSLYQGFLLESLNINNSQEDVFHKKALSNIVEKKLLKAWKSSFKIENSRVGFAVPHCGKLWFPNKVPNGVYFENKTGKAAIYRSPTFLPSDMSSLELFQEPAFEKCLKNVVILGFEPNPDKEPVPSDGDVIARASGGDFDGDLLGIMFDFADCVEDPKYKHHYIEMPKAPGGKMTHKELCETIKKSITTATLMGMSVWGCTTLLNKFRKMWNCTRIWHAGDTQMISADAVKRGADIEKRFFKTKNGRFVIIESKMYNRKIVVNLKWVPNFLKKGPFDGGLNNGTIPCSIASFVEDFIAELRNMRFYGQRALDFFAEVAKAHKVNPWADQVCPKKFQNYDTEYGKRMKEIMCHRLRLLNRGYDPMYVDNIISEEMNELVSEYRTKIYYAALLEFKNKLETMLKTATDEKLIEKIKYNLNNINKEIEVEIIDGIDENGELIVNKHQLVGLDILRS